MTESKLPRKRAPANVAAASSPLEWEYAPAPESRDIVRFQERYGLFVGGEQVEPLSGEWYSTIEPANEEHLAEIAQAREEDVDLAVGCGAGRLRERLVGAAAAPSGPSTSSASRAILLERSREFAVAESLNSGKPIRESRDVDVPIAAAHFFYYAGLGRQARVRVPEPPPAAARRRRPDHPLELPAADARLEDRAGARVRQHRRAEAVPHDARSPRSSSPTSAARRGCRPASSTSSPATAARAPRSSAIPGIDKIAFTGSTERRQGHPAGDRRHAASASRSSSAARPPNIVFDDCALDQAVEGIINGIYFNQGEVCCAGSRLLVQESIYEQIARAS